MRQFSQDSSAKGWPWPCDDNDEDDCDGDQDDDDDDDDESVEGSLTGHSHVGARLQL